MALSEEDRNVIGASIRSSSGLTIFFFAMFTAISLLFNLLLWDATLKANQQAVREEVQSALKNR